MEASSSQNRWLLIQRLCAEVVGLDEKRREARLRRIKDPTLRSEVESLLERLEHGESIGDPPAPDVALDRLADETAPSSAEDEHRSEGERVGRYRLVEELGRGAMGVVYRAEDTRLGRAVALKFLSPELSSDKRARARLEREARAASALDHPNICTVYEIGETDDGRLYLALACYDGETLEDRIERGPLEVEEAVRIAVRMARGLAAAHRQGIVHRDVKPSNVLVTDSGEVKLLDFGIARVADSELTGTGDTLGTAAYMSPEQLRGQPEPRSDVWALGVVLYEMLSGRRPFSGDYEAALLYAILHEEPPPLAQFRQDVPEELAEVVLRCLEKDLESRYESAEVLEMELRREEHQSPGFSTSARTSQQQPAGYRGRWIAFTAVVLAAVAIAALTPQARTNIIEALGLPRAISPTSAPNTVGAARADVYYSRGLDHLERAVGAEEADEEVDEAIRWFERALGRDPRFALAHVGLGEAYLRRYEAAQDDRWVAAALDHARDALVLDGQLAPVHVVIGRVYAKTGRPDHAMREFQRALEIDSANATAYRGIAELHEDGGDVDAAEAAYRQAAALRPDYWVAHNDLGMFLYERGRFEEALESFLRVTEQTPTPLIELSEERFKAYTRLEEIYKILGRSGEARAMYERLVEVAPSRNAYVHLGNLYYYTGLYTNALAAFTQAIGYDPEDGRFSASDYLVIGSMGASLYQLSKTEERPQMRTPLLHTPTQASELEEQADGYFKRATIAGESFLMDANRDAPFVHSKLAVYYAYLNERDRALDHLGNAVEKTPDDAEILYNVACAYELLGWRQEAVENMEAAMRRGHPLFEVERDPFLSDLRTDPRLHMVLESMREGRLREESFSPDNSAGASLSL